MKRIKIEDWHEEMDNRRREYLRNQSALNRLGQSNFNGVQRSPVRRGPDPRPESDRCGERW